MSAENSAIDSAAEAIPRTDTLKSVLHAGEWLRTSFRRFWADQLFLQQRLLEKTRPWESEGPTCWKRELGGWRLVGSRVPDLETQNDGASKDAS
ncbi:MAG TPA: hypothetical protein VIJ34_05150 [Acidimicrobiales bacterium]